MSTSTDHLLTNLKRLRVWNFQSIEFIDLSFKENGVYHLIGANNIGKSAILKTINIACENANRMTYKEFIRDNCDTFIVELTFHDDSVILLSRGANDYYQFKLLQSDNTYLEGRLDKTDGKVPSEIESYLNLYKDKEKTKHNLNFRLVDDLKLFVQTSDGDNYYLLQKALRTEEYLSALKLAGKEKRQISSQLKTVEEFYDNEKLKQRELELEYTNSHKKMKDIESSLEVIESEYEEFLGIEQLVNYRRELKRLKDELAEEEKHTVTEKELKQIRDQIAETTALHDTIELVKEIKQLNKEYKEISNLQNDINLEEIKSLIAELSIIDSVITLDGEIQKLEADVKNLSSVKPSQLKEMKNLIAEITKIENVITVGKEITKYNKDYKLAQEEYAEADENLATFMRENKFCPIVAKTINKQCPFGQKIS